MLHYCIQLCFLYHYHFNPLSSGKEIKFDGLSLSTCHSIINLMDVSFQVTDSFYACHRVTLFALNGCFTKIVILMPTCPYCTTIQSYRIYLFFWYFVCVCLCVTERMVLGVSYFPQCFLGFFLDTVNQVDNTGKIEFQEFKVFWEKMKKWIVCVDLYWKTVNELCDESWGSTFLCCSDY